MFDEARKTLGDASAILRSVNTTDVAIAPFCDILKMYSCTESYFTQSEKYKKCKSGTVYIRNCDVRHPEGANMNKENQGQVKYKGRKEYDSQYIWGQLVGWFKQTVDKPNASLSADRRGTLSIPDVQSFIVHNDNFSIETVNGEGVVVTNSGVSGGSAQGGGGQAAKKRGKTRRDRERDSTLEEVMPSK